tara:strand:- start:845 stop:1093 length:249 start_codon:yes stop_codon:yes gene_type:complete
MMANKNDYKNDAWTWRLDLSERITKLEEMNSNHMVQSDRIEDHLVRLNGRVGNNEKDISKVKGIGVAVSALFGIILGWIGIK